jgi:predicted NAD/FAD-binding protein
MVFTGNEIMKIAVFGASNVGLSNTILLSQKHEVNIFDIGTSKVD